MFCKKDTTWCKVLSTIWRWIGPCVSADFRYGVKSFQVRSWFSPKGDQLRSHGNLSTSHCEPHGGARGKVRGLPNPSGYIVCYPSAGNSMTIQPKVAEIVQSGPKW